MTVWKQAFVLGGAVLLLAACDRATGPSTQLQQKRAAAARLTDSTTTSDTTSTQDLCRSGYSVSSGKTSDLSSDSCSDTMILDY